MNRYFSRGEQEIKRCKLACMTPGSLFPITRKGWPPPRRETEALEKCDVRSQAHGFAAVWESPVKSKREPGTRPHGNMRVWAFLPLFMWLTSGYPHFINKKIELSTLFTLIFCLQGAMVFILIRTGACRNRRGGLVMRGYFRIGDSIAFFCCFLAAAFPKGSGNRKSIEMGL